MASHGIERLPVAPFSFDLLADLHAGVLSDSVSTRLWPLVRADESAMEVLAALDAVSSRLGNVGSDLGSGLPMPPEVAERIDRALASEHSVSQHPVPQDPVRSIRKTRRPPVWLFGAAAAAVLLLALVTVVLVSTVDRSETGTVAAPSNSSVLTLDSADIDASVVHSVMQKQDPVPLVDSGKLPDCLEANGIGRDTVVLGATAVDIDGRSGTMLILPRYPADGTTVLAVGSGCDTGNPQPLFRRDVD
ncbi:hypothetical protein [Rhodococcoides yunnanense]|uniref:hypothetical protein n=1 Tax=Rhodococcoides yunnanense TaxID=278209 RepID=UPI001114A20B|nr:hypothetical protein [Rhodococcus yunnanensis]